jgi:hypothetical protein
MCFSYDISKLAWDGISGDAKTSIGNSYGYDVGLLISNKKNCAINMVTYVVMRNKWQMRNEFFWKTNLE